MARPAQGVRESGGGSNGDRRSSTVRPDIATAAAIVRAHFAD